MITQTVIHPDAAGIDLAAEVHCVAVPADRDPQPVRNLGPTTDHLIVLADWLQKCGLRTVAMESTGVYGIPLFELLEQRAYGRKQADGTTTFWITNYNVPDPRRFILTNTISFRAGSRAGVQTGP